MIVAIFVLLMSTQKDNMCADAMANLTYESHSNLISYHHLRASLKLIVSLLCNPRVILV